MHFMPTDKDSALFTSSRIS